jgi:hypothetical protein
MPRVEEDLVCFGRDPGYLLVFFESENLAHLIQSSLRGGQAQFCARD